MIRFWLTAISVLAMMAGGALLAQPSASPPGVGEPIMTPRGPGVVTGTTGSTATTTIPGSASQGTLTNNGNGTSLSSVPGQPPTAVATPK